MLRHTQYLYSVLVRTRSTQQCGAGGKTHGLARLLVKLSSRRHSLGGGCCVSVVCSVLLQELSVHSHSNVFSSGATMPARAPASIAMLHT